MKYFARSADYTWKDTWEVVQDVGKGWRVIAERLSRAEAGIISFSLNAVADGEDLLSGNGEWTTDKYNGPTEGVAPSA